MAPAHSRALLGKVLLGFNTEKDPVLAMRRWPASAHSPKDTYHLRCFRERAEGAMAIPPWAVQRSSGGSILPES